MKGKNQKLTIKERIEMYLYQKNEMIKELLARDKDMGDVRGSQYKPFTLSGIANGIGKKPHNIQKSLMFMVIDGVIERFGSKKKFYRLSKYSLENYDVFHPPRKINTYIPHPYPEAPNFTGRIHERKIITEWLVKDKKHPLLSVSAIGGMGKSALVWRWLQKDVIGEGTDKTVKRIELDGIVWWSFYEKGMTFDSFVRSFAAYRWGKDHPMLSWPISDLKNAVYQEFQQKKYLIVLDGIERILKAYFGLGSPYIKDNVTIIASDSDYSNCIEPNAGFFLQCLSNQITQSKTLLTTRIHPFVLSDLEGCLKYNLDPLTKADAVSFLYRQGVRGTRVEIEKECKKYGYHPLSLRLLSGLIVSTPGNSGDINVCKMLNLIKDTAPRDHNILELAYDTLNNDSKREFVSSLSAFRSPMDYSAIKAISKFEDEKELQGVLKEVVNRGILFQRKEKDQDEKINTIYSMHPIVRAYCYDRLQDKEGVHSQLQDYYTTIPEPKKIDKIDDLQPVIELYHHTVCAGRYDEALELFYGRLNQVLYYKFGYYTIGLELLEAFRINDAIEENVFKNHYNLSLFLNLFGSYLFQSAKTVKALVYFKRGFEVSEKDNDPKSLIFSLSNLGTCSMLTGNMLESNNYLIRGIQVSQKERIKFREGTIHQNLGLNNIFLKNYKQARREFDEAISDYENVIQLESDENIKKYAKMRIGFLYSFISLLKYYVGNYRSSLKYAIKASQTNRDEKRGLIWGKWLIGASHIAMGDAKSAETPLYFAITECRKINLVELEAAILLQLAKLNHLRGNDYEALKVITEALEIASRCSYVLQQADIHLFLSKYYRDTGDLDKAREHAGLAKLRSHQMIDVETGDYVTKDEGTKWKYKPCYDKAVKLLEELGKMENV